MAETRKPGAQPNNKNAFKHGFYSRRCQQLEQKELNQSGHDLEDEIALMKVLMRRVFEAANQEEGDLDMWFKTLSTLGLASTRLAKLLDTQKVLQGDNASEISGALKQALKEVTRELGT